VDIEMKGRGIKKMGDIIVVGGGLAGAEAAWQIAERGGKVELVEMRPCKMTPAHKTHFLAELLCSNSLKSDVNISAPGLLKKEMRLLDSLIIKVADETRIPAGTALAVDRHRFASKITHMIETHKNISVVRKEFQELSSDNITIIASGPLTSIDLQNKIQDILGKESLFFYDAISPIIDGDSIDYEKVFFASRYNKGGADYLNCPLSKEQYIDFYNELIEGDIVPLKDFEKEMFFEGCLPIEELARRGEKALAYGPLKPVGLKDKNGLRPFAVVQLRKENKEGKTYSMVGFQTRLTYQEQKRIFRMIPGLEKVRFLQYGSRHRNTYINSPLILNEHLQVKFLPHIFIAGQLTGVEGYIESASMGLIAGINAIRFLRGDDLFVPPPTTAIGSLIRFITGSHSSQFQPTNINFGLFPSLNSNNISKSKRKIFIVERAMKDIQKWSIIINKQNKNTLLKVLV